MCAPRCCPGGGSRSVLQAAASWAPSGLTCQAKPLRQSGVLGSQPPCVRDWGRSGFTAAWCELSLFPASNSESAPGALTGIKCLPGRPHPPKLLTQQLPGPPALHLEVGTVPPAGFTPLPCQVLLRLSLRGGLGWPWILEGTSREGRVSFYKEEAWTRFQAEAVLASKVGSGEPLVAQRCHKNVGFQVPEGTPPMVPTRDGERSSCPAGRCSQSSNLSGEDSASRFPPFTAELGAQLSCPQPQGTLHHAKDPVHARVQPLVAEGPLSVFS